MQTELDMTNSFRPHTVLFSSMIPESDSDDDGNATCDKYRPGENRLLSTALLQTIEEHKGKDASQSKFQLYDVIDPDALNNLFQEDARPEPTVEFTVDAVGITLRGAESGDGVVIRVTDRSGSNGSRAV